MIILGQLKKPYPIAPLCGYFEGCDKDCEYNTVDFNKAYTSNAKDISLCLTILIYF